MQVFSDIFRSLFFILDKLLYNLVEVVYGLFLEIANTTIFTDDMVESFAGKIYYLVGIFMLFKVSFSILTYIVNPDAFADKSKGMGKLVTNTITSLAMLLAVPFIFEQAMDIQKIVLKDNIIPKIFSTEFENGTKINITQDPGQGSQIALMAFEAFYSPPSAPQTLAETFSTDVNQKDSNGEYITEYSFLISTVVGVFLVLLLVSFCFDIALRSVKLGFLRLIAPVPIISRIDPKKGNEIFSKWTKTCVSTYLDIFMRLAAIFFAIYIIQALQAGMFVDAVTGDNYSPSAFTKVFIILGVLMFAKQLPKLLEDILGVKLSGSFTLNPMKKMADVPLAGKLAAASIGAADSVAHGNGLMAGFKRNWNNVSWGGDAKNSILETADRKMRREVRAKRDNAKDRYEGAERQKVLEQQLTDGEAYASQDPESIFDSRFLESKNSVENAKTAMYAWKNEVARAEANYQAATSKFGANSNEAKTAYKALETANKNYGSAQGQYEYRKKLHDAVRQQYVKDAKIEDAIEAFEKTGGKKIAPPPSYEGSNASSTSSTPSSSSASSYKGSYSPTASSTSSSSSVPSNSYSDDDILNMMMESQQVIEDEKYMNGNYDAYSYTDQYMGNFAPTANNDDSKPDYFSEYYDYSEPDYFNQYYDDEN